MSGNRNGRGGGSLGCCIMNSLAETLSNLFSTEPWCGSHCGCGGQNSFENGFISGVNAAQAAEQWNNGCGCNQGNGGCGCNGQGGWANGWNNGFANGVNIANTVNEINGGQGCGCGCNQGNNGCGCNQGNGCGCYDAYYARQYGLYPFQSGSCCNN